MKRCSKCKETKPVSAFSKNKAMRDGYGNWCKACRGIYHNSEEAKIKRRDYMRRLRSTPEGYRKARSAQLLCKYGIDMDDYDDMFRFQNGQCAICYRTPEECSDARTGTQALFIDHDHESGHVRGLLCNRCNRAIGMFGHDVALLRLAAEYLL